MVAFSGLFFIHDMESFRWQAASCLEGSAAAAAAATAGSPIKSNSFDIYKKQHTCEKASIMVISTEHLTDLKTTLLGLMAPNQYRWFSPFHKHGLFLLTLMGAEGKGES